MAIYLGNSERLKIFLNGVCYKVNVHLPIIPEVLILASSIDSSEEFWLKDIEGLYITPKEDK